MRTPGHAQRSGVASLLLEHIITEARRWGSARLSLETGSAEFFARPAAVREVRVRLVRAVRPLPARPAEFVPDQDAVRGGMRVGRWPPKA